MITRIKKRVLVNPHRKPKRKLKAAPKRKAKKRANARPNPPQLISLGYINPHKGARNVQRKRRKKNAARRRSPRRNPTIKLGKHSRRRRNPGLITRTGGFLRMGIVAVLGAFITRQVPQWLLGARNTGIAGYAANIATALTAASLIGRVSNRDDAASAAVGGAVYTVNRMASELPSGPIRALALSGMGDPSAVSGLRGLQPAYFPTPVAWQGGRPVIPQAIIDAARPSPPPGSQMAGLRMRRAA